MSISNVAVPDNGFFRIVNSETKASGRVSDFMRRRPVDRADLHKPEERRASLG